MNVAEYQSVGTSRFMLTVSFPCAPVVRHLSIIYNYNATFLLLLLLMLLLLRCLVIDFTFKNLSRRSTGMAGHFTDFVETGPV